MTFVFPESIDFYASVLFPLVFLALGIPLAIYTGFVTGRILLFEQEKQRTVELLLSYIDTYRRALAAETPEDARTILMWPLIMPSVAFTKSQSQRYAGLIVRRVGRLLQRGANRSTREIIATKSTHSPDFVITLIRSEMQRFEEAIVYSIARVDRLRPNYWIIFGMPTVERLLRRLRRKRTKFTRRWAKFIWYINGSDPI